jgi:uncharacterized protein (TIGR02588 family)
MSRPIRGIARKRTPLELGVLIVSVLSVLAIVVGLVVSGITGGAGGPDLRASAEPTGEERSGGAVYEVSIRNDGGETAENVVVEVTIGDQVREFELLSVAKGDEETATLIFPPGTSQDATVRILSYHSSTRG